MNKKEERREQKTSSLQPNLSSSDPYAVLGLSRRASKREIKLAYFKLVRQYPPETDGDLFKHIRAAYEKLQSEETKTKTDLFLFRPPPVWKPRKRKGKLDLDFDPQDIWLSLRHYGDLHKVDFQDDYTLVKI